MLDPLKLPRPSWTLLNSVYDLHSRGKWWHTGTVMARTGCDLDDLAVICLQDGRGLLRCVESAGNPIRSDSSRSALLTTTYLECTSSGVDVITSPVTATLRALAVNQQGISIFHLLQCDGVTAEGILALQGAGLAFVEQAATRNLVEIDASEWHVVWKYPKDFAVRLRPTARDIVRHIAR